MPKPIDDVTEAVEEQDERDQEANDVTGSGRIREHEDANGKRDDPLDTRRPPVLPRFPGCSLPSYVLRVVLHLRYPFPCSRRDGDEACRIEALSPGTSLAGTGGIDLTLPQLTRGDSIDETAHREAIGFQV